MSFNCKLLLLLRRASAATARCSRAPSVIGTGDQLDIDSKDAKVLRLRRGTFRRDDDDDGWALPTLNPRLVEVELRRLELFPALPR